LKYRILLGVGILTALAFMFYSRSVAHSASAAQQQQQPHSDRKLAPDFALQDANGSSVKLSDYRGRVVLLNFWATWCGPCGLEIPWFVEFEQQYKSQGFEVVGVSMDEDGWKAIKPYVTEHKVNYRVLLGSDSVTQLYGGVDSLPTTFVLDRGGKIAFVHVGLAAKEDYLSEIQGLLGVNQTNNSRAALGVLPAALVTGAAK
jgi:cytochrome c biogenesis protein CcmG/thiol:disulfide interchange protein DsbE